MRCVPLWMGSLSVSKASGRIAVDSNAVIAYREGNAEACHLIEEAEVLFMPVVVLGELLYGAMNSLRKEENERDVRDFAEQCVLIYTDESVATRYANLRCELKRLGRPTPENDIWIAAACLEVGASLMSRDEHFNCMENLRVVAWIQ